MISGHIFFCANTIISDIFQNFILLNLSNYLNATPVLEVTSSTQSNFICGIKIRISFVFSEIRRFCDSYSIKVFSWNISSRIHNFQEISNISFSFIYINSIEGGSYSNFTVFSFIFVC